MNKPNGPTPTSNLGAQTSIQPDSPIPDWITLHPKVSHTAYRLYAMMRALYFAGDGEPLTITRRELAEMFPGQGGGPSSINAVQKALNALSEIGLLTDPDPKPTGLRRVRRYEFNETPDLAQGSQLQPSIRQSIVYLIGSPGSSVAKIGITKNLPERLSTLQRASSHQVAAMWTTPGGAPLEAWLHEQFHGLRTHGEWFDFGDQDPVATVAAKAAQYGGASK